MVQINNKELVQTVFTTHKPFLFFVALDFLFIIYPKKICLPHVVYLPHRTHAARNSKPDDVRGEVLEDDGAAFLFALQKLVFGLRRPYNDVGAKKPF